MWMVTVLPAWTRPQVDTDPAAVITGSPVVYDGVAYLGISSKGEASTADSFCGLDLADVSARLEAFGDHYNFIAKPFNWK